MVLLRGTNFELTFTLRFFFSFRRLKDHPIHLDPPSMGAFMHAFSEVDKLTYQGTDEDDGLVPFLFLRRVLY